MKADFKPIHFYNHESCESFQIVSRKGLMNWINDFTQSHNAFDTYEQLKDYCLDAGEEWWVDLKPTTAIEMALMDYKKLQLENKEIQQNDLRN